MSTSTITIEHDDETKEVMIYVSGGDGTLARFIAEDIMAIASKSQGDNFKGDSEFTVQ